MTSCSKCGEPKREDEFATYKNRTGTGRRSYCITCNRKQISKGLKAIRQKNRELLDAAKACPCADCGKEYPPYVMDFDHVRGVKLGDIATLATQARAAILIQEEISKCDVVCANCHRERTYRRRVAS